MSADNRPGSAITEAACWAHGRRKFYVLADTAAKARDPRIVISPIALEAVRRIDAIFDIQCTHTGMHTDDRRAIRQACVKTLVNDLHVWMKEQRGRVSSSHPPSAAVWLRLAGADQLVT